MNNHSEELELIANSILNQQAKNKDENKPNYSNRDFMNCLIIFQNAMMDKLYDNQNDKKMSIENRLEMANVCGNDLRKLIFTYTGLDTHKVEDFI